MFWLGCAVPRLFGGDIISIGVNELASALDLALDLHLPYHQWDARCLCVPTYGSAFVLIDGWGVFGTV